MIKLGGKGRRPISRDVLAAGESAAALRHRIDKHSSLGNTVDIDPNPQLNRPNQYAAELHVIEAYLNDTEIIEFDEKEAERMDLILNLNQQQDEKYIQISDIIEHLLQNHEKRTNGK